MPLCALSPSIAIICDRFSAKIVISTYDASTYYASTYYAWRIAVRARGAFSSPLRRSCAPSVWICSGSAAFVPEVLRSLRVSELRRLGVYPPIALGQGLRSGKSGPADQAQHHDQEWNVCCPEDRHERRLDEGVFNCRHDFRSSVLRDVQSPHATGVLAV